MDNLVHKQHKVVSANKLGKFKDRHTTSSTSICKSKFVGVRQRPSGKWVAEIKDTTQNIRMWLGTFNTPEKAARAYDEAACLLRGSNTRTNFSSHLHSEPSLSLKIRNLLNQKISLKRNSSKTNTIQPSIQSAVKIGSNRGIANDVSSKLADDIDNSLFSTATNQEVQMFDNAYRPELSTCIGELEPGFSQFNHSWWHFSVGLNLDQPPLLKHERVQIPRQVAEMSNSESLYGVNDYLGNAYDPSYVVWETHTPMCQLFSTS